MGYKLTFISYPNNFVCYKMLIKEVIKTKQTLKSIYERLNNKGTIISLAALIVSLICQFGIEIDSEKILAIVQTICNILIILGLLNNPVDNTDVYIPGISDQLKEKEEE